MSDKVDIYKQALILTSSDHVLWKQRDSLVEQIIDEGWGKALLISMSEDLGRGSVATPQDVSQPRASTAPSSATSAAPFSDERRGDLTRIHIPSPQAFDLYLLSKAQLS